MINQALNYLSTEIFNYIFCVKISEASFNRNMDDLLHTSTLSIYIMPLQDMFKESHSDTTGTTAWREPAVAFLAPSTPLQHPNVLGSSLRIRWPISHQPFSDFRSVRPYQLRHLLCPDRGKLCQGSYG